MLHHMVSGVNSLTKADWGKWGRFNLGNLTIVKSNIRKMASKQTGQNEFTAQAVAETTRVAIQTMATTSMARQENAGIKVSRPIMKLQMFNWRAREKEILNLK